MVNPSGRETVSEAFDKIMAGLDDARAYLSGKRDGFALHKRVGVAVHETDAPFPDAVAIRSKTGLSRDTTGARPATRAGDAQAAGRSALDVLPHGPRVPRGPAAGPRG